MLWTCDNCGKEAEHVGSPAKMGDPPPEGWLKEQRGSQITNQCGDCSGIRQAVSRMFEEFWQKCREEAEKRGIAAFEVAREKDWDGLIKRAEKQVIDDEWFRKFNEDDFKE